MTNDSTGSHREIDPRWSAVIACASIFVLLVATASRSPAQPTVKDVLEHGAKQELAETPKGQEPKGPVDDFDRGTPRRSIAGFLAATRFAFPLQTTYIENGAGLDRCHPTCQMSCQRALPLFCRASRPGE